MQATLDTRVGGGFRFRLLDGVAAGRVVAYAPVQHISYAWDWEGAPLGVATTVAFDLIAHGSRTHLTLRHVGFRTASQAAAARCAVALLVRPAGGRGSGGRCFRLRQRPTFTPGVHSWRVHGPRQRLPVGTSGSACRPDSARALGGRSRPRFTADVHPRRFRGRPGSVSAVDSARQACTGVCPEHLTVGVSVTDVRAIDPHR